MACLCPSLPEVVAYHSGTRTPFDGLDLVRTDPTDTYLLFKCPSCDLHWQLDSPAVAGSERRALKVTHADDWKGVEPAL